MANGTLLWSASSFHVAVEIKDEMTMKKKSFESLQSVKSKEDSRQKNKKKMELKNGSIGHQIFHFSEEYF